MDFEKLRIFRDETNLQIEEMAKEHNLDFKQLKHLCEIIGFDTSYTYAQAIVNVNHLLKNKYSVNNIILFYNLDKSLF